jgi:hypothetical protein
MAIIVSAAKEAASRKLIENSWKSNKAGKRSGGPIINRRFDRRIGIAEWQKFADISLKWLNLHPNLKLRARRVLTLSQMTVVVRIDERTISVPGT